MHTLTFRDQTQTTPGSAVGTPGLVFLMDCAHPLTIPHHIHLADVHRVVIGRGPERRYQHGSGDDSGQLHIELPDRWLSTRHVLLVQESDTWCLYDPGSKNGTFVNRRKVSQAVLQDRDIIEIGHAIFWYRTHLSGPTAIGADHSMPVGIDSLNPELSARFQQLPKIARSELSVVITGETGTGKELVARAIHEMSGRSGRFVALNCGALPGTIIESELFGAEKGAFSGAVKNRAGLVRAADGGTLFLDEIAELPLSSQAVLLRVLQEGEVLPVGATRPIAVDLRVLAATHRDLDAQVESGAFRKDLLARLRGFAVHLPPLRDRREDVGRIVATLLERIVGDRAATIRFTRKAARRLFAHDWPMNVRELEQVLRAALVLCESGEIDVAHLPSAIGDRARPDSAPAPPDPAPAMPEAGPAAGAGARGGRLRASDPDAPGRLIALARVHGGNIAAIARALGTSRSQVRRLLKRHDIDPRRLPEPDGTR